MSNSPIIESGMKFGPFTDGQCFHIENSNSYKAIQGHVQIAEFLLLQKDNEENFEIWIVEAKSSTPRPETQPNFDHFVAETRDKLINAFSLGLASCLRRHKQAEAELPEYFKSLNLSQVGVKFVLVINGHQEKWLPPLQEALGKALRSTVKTWALAPNSVAVINEVLAQRWDLIQLSQEDGA